MHDARKLVAGADDPTPGPGDRLHVRRLRLPGQLVPADVLWPDRPLASLEPRHATRHSPPDHGHAAVTNERSGPERGARAPASLRASARKRSPDGSASNVRTS